MPLKRAAALFFSSGRNNTEFLPAALEIIETPASPAGRAIAASIILFFLITLVWACWGTVDIIATASGKIVPSGRTKIIQPFETGVVRAIHVQDGQHVKTGEVLIEIDPTINEAEQMRLQQELTAARLDVARLKAFLAAPSDPMQAFAAPENASHDQIRFQRQLLANQVEEITAKLKSLDKQIAQSQGNLAAVRSTIDKLSKALPILKRRHAMRSELAEKGYGSQLNALATQQDLVEHEKELQVQKGRLAEAVAAVAAYKEQRRLAEAEYRRNSLTELAQAEQKADSLKEQLAQASQKYKLQTLVSPVDGTVQQLAVHTEGGVVTPAQSLLVVVPAESKLEIEAMISNRDIGFVYPGQRVAIKIDTFNFTKYGLLEGEVVSVSKDAIVRPKPQPVGDKNPSGSENETSEPNGQEWVYMARVRLQQTQMNIDGKVVDLKPGMAITAEIKTGERRIIEYLLSPLARHQQSALRER